MVEVKNELSNLSYTNKDFSSIYPELLDIVKKLSYKWDPTVSDESDPGVVLLKLNALMTDKLNYNIDKNILELFPSSVTQYQNAREVFDQCGYSMHYYNSAEAMVSFVLTKKPTLEQVTAVPNGEYNPEEDCVVTIPQFTMLTNPDNTLVYTIVGGDVRLTSDSTDVPVLAREGKIQDYIINGDSLILSSMLDPQNRLYFSGLDIAENGIFIKNELYNYDKWKRVDNLVLEEPKTPCYKFGITKDGTRCFIEFPDDIYDIIGKGLTIKYLRTSGKNGHANIKNICKFYSDTTASVYQNANDTLVGTFNITTDHVFFVNRFPSEGGKDPETIEEANKNYQKVKTTFDTLVSLRDYNNFIYTSNMVSNGFVTDRLNDPQSSYSIVNLSDSSEKIHNKVKTKELTLYKLDNSDEVQVSDIIYYKDEKSNKVFLDKQDEMNAFDLRIYGFNYVDNPTSEYLYNQSFESLHDLQENYTQFGLQDKWTELTDSKVIQHDFCSYEKNRPFIFKNKYPIKVKIIPTYRLDNSSKTEITNKVRLAIFSLLNSRNMSWGASPDYSIVYDTILTADQRIRAILLDEFSYETYAVYLDEDSNIKEVRIDSDYEVVPEDEDKIVNDIRSEIKNRSYLAGVTPYYHKESNFNFSIGQHTSNITTNVIKINPQTKLTATSESLNDNISVSFEVGPNEQLTFTAPNIIDDQPYANYVKYICNVDISANGEHTLTDSEYIIFFWKADENEETSYSYHLYTPTTRKLGILTNIISPNFTLYSNDNITDITYGGSVTTNLNSFISTCIRTKKNSGNTNNINNIDEDISKLIDNRFVLTGSKTITSKKINQVELSSTNSDVTYITWQLNNSTPNILFNQGQSQRILGKNEYLCYTNSSKTSLNLLGEGTRITRNDDWQEPCSLPDNVKVDLANGNSDLLTSLTDCWWMLPKTSNKYKITATEQKFVSLGENSSVTFKLPKPDDEITAYNLDHSGLYVTDEDTDEDLLISLTNVTITYSSGSSSIEEELEERNSEDTAWNVSLTLNLNTSPNNPQFLITESLKEPSEESLEEPSEESFSRKQSLDVTYVAADGRTLTNSISNCNICTSDELSVSGNGEDQDIYILDKDTQHIKDSTSIYQYNFSYDTETVEETSVGSLMCNLKADKSSIAIKTSLPEIIDTEDTEGGYILPVYLSGDVHSIEYSLVKKDTDPEIKYIIYNLLNDDSTLLTSGYVLTDDDSKAGYHWYYFNSDSNSNYDTFKITYATTDNDVKLYLLPPVKVTDINTAHEIAMELFQKYDNTKQFNYTPNFNTNAMIEEPLKSSSFFDPKHVMNKYTIAQVLFSTNSENTSTLVIEDRLK